MNLSGILSPNLDDKVSHALIEYAEHRSVVWLEKFEHISGQCGSPIEVILLAAMMRLFDGDNPHPVRVSGREFHKALPLPTFGAELFAQAKMNHYRVDFLLRDVPDYGHEPKFIIIECDGHEFHDRTKAQAKRDRQRDRYFALRKAIVLRFTGSEIWADADDVAEQIYEFLGR